VPETAAAANALLRAAARLSRWASQSASFDIPFAQARLLALVDELGPVRVSALAEADHSSQPTVTSQVHRLEAAGWARREPDPADARATLVSLTEHGAAALARVRAARAEVLDPVLARLDGHGLERVQAATAVLDELLELASTQATSPSPAL
jgi:DNA-binding MarR family transcriptional regulator